jgi:glycosyltransferase involved in cell wall biosynthesis
VGIQTLFKALRNLGIEVDLVAPKYHLPIYTAQRLLFNERLRFDRMQGYDVTVGFDMDGYRIAGRGCGLHVASIKGVIADEMRYETGLTRATMAIQSRCEATHVGRANLVMTTSAYAAERMKQLYEVSGVRIVPECIDLTGWEELLRRHPATPDPRKFVVLSVARFYRRKRLQDLLGAAVLLRNQIPGLEIRIVGDGPERKKLMRLHHAKALEGTVKFLGDVSQDELAAEYARCDVFSLPSVQEGFGIVFLEAMTACKPIVAVRAAAVPEVVRHGILVEPENESAIAAAIEKLYRDPQLGASLGAAGRQLVSSYDAPRIAQIFLSELKPKLE